MKYLPLALTGLGLLLEIRGAYLAAQQFQVFTFWTFLRRALRLSVTHVFSFDSKTVFTKGEALLAEKLKTAMEQQHLDTGYEFAGLALLLVGFLLQAIALLIQLADVGIQGFAPPPRARAMLMND